MGSARWLVGTLVAALLLVGVGGSLIATPALVLALQVLTLQQAASEMDPDVSVEFTDKPDNYDQTRGYFGDSVGVVVRNFHDYPIRVTARVGDVLIGRGHGKQNLVVTKPLILDVGARDHNSADGVYTACIDAVLGPPPAGGFFDIGPNIAEWDYEEAHLLMQLLQQINQEGIWEKAEVQKAIWKITSNCADSYPPTRALLERAGIDPDRDYVGLPHPANPDPDTVGHDARCFTAEELGIRLRPQPDLVITLSWEGEADLDLWVTEPSGEKIYSDHPTSGSGGILDQVSGCGVTVSTVVGDMVVFAAPERREHTYWYVPPYGTYTVEINYREACWDGGTATWRVTVEVGDDERQFTGTIEPNTVMLVDQFTISPSIIETGSSPRL